MFNGEQFLKLFSLSIKTNTSTHRITEHSKLRPMVHDKDSLVIDRTRHFLDMVVFFQFQLYKNGVKIKQYSSKRLIVNSLQPIYNGINAFASFCTVFQHL